MLITPGMVDRASLCSLSCKRYQTGLPEEIPSEGWVKRQALSLSFPLFLPYSISEPSTLHPGGPLLGRPLCYLLIFFCSVPSTEGRIVLSSPLLSFLLPGSVPLETLMVASVKTI